jgi:hypothetical protein
MFNRHNRQSADERLERVARALVRAAADNEEAFEQAAAAPHAYARVRARIAAAQATRASETDEGWLALLAVAPRAVPALTAVAASVFALMLWLASGQMPAASGFGDEAYYGSEAGVEQVVLRDANTLSRDEVLTIVVNREGQVTR